MEHAAGIIIVRYFEDEPKILGLKIYSGFDFPKGRIEEGEDPFEAAKRECFEEAGISDLDFRWGHGSIKVLNTGKRKKDCTLFLATSDQEPTIRKNPETGMFEHHSVKWLTLDEAEASMYTYLRPAVGWVREMLDSTLKRFISSVAGE